MTREAFLRKGLEMESNNLLCYSANYLMDKPKHGYEKEWKEAVSTVEMLEAWLDEFTVVSPPAKPDIEQVIIEQSMRLVNCISATDADSLTKRIKTLMEVKRFLDSNQKTDADLDGVMEHFKNDM